MTNTEKTRIFNRGIARTTRSILLSLVYLAFLTTNLAAQSGGATTSSYKADQNLKSSARVNPSTLAMEFTLPITNYQGRNGNSVPIIFNYSSKLWGTTIVDSRSEDFISGGTRYINDFSKARLEYSKNSSSGWNSSLGSPKIVKSNSIFIEFGEYTSNSLGEDELPDDLLPEIDEIATSGSGNTVCRTTFEVIRSRLYECEVCFRVVNGVRVTYGYCRDRSGGDPPPGPDPSPTPPVRRILYYVWRVQIAPGWKHC